MINVHTLNLFLWVAQAFLAVFFVFAGLPKITGRGIERWTGFSEVPRGLVVFIGVTEILGAAGLIVPMVTGTLPWLTPLAAIGLAVIVLMAAGFHLRADERLQALETGLWSALASVVAIGRWNVVLISVDAPAWILVGAIAVLIPAVVVNIVILLQQPASLADRQEVVS